jgi:transcriptional regulator with XRE-family HTH domain
MPTPAISAVAAEPPKTSTSSSTERGIGIDNSRYMKTSRAIHGIHVSTVDSSPDVKCAKWMGSRDEIIARLRKLPLVLGKSDTELARICGVAASTWSNYKSKKASKNIIIWQAALELWNVYGIPMEWTYDGQVGRVPDADLREKLALANRAAEAERRHSKRH